MDVSREATKGCATLVVTIINVYLTILQRRVGPSSHLKWGTEHSIGMSNNFYAVILDLWMSL